MIDCDMKHFDVSDWLINRRHCSQEWPARAVVIREKINEALTDMPQNPQILELLEGTRKKLLQQPYYNMCDIPWLSLCLLFVQSSSLNFVTCNKNNTEWQTKLLCNKYIDLRIFFYADQHIHIAACRSIAHRRPVWKNQLINIIFHDWLFIRPKTRLPFGRRSP